ncbi:cation transport protein-domain-containing protein [Absidia repens]|uniref:Cation transport protein-domain-containing protein n=1 Tax=Absidia repens TaxID=90262 RepID=A0A1X2I0S2_9FUNG|nr:cation transport protein-domain-containing protein [Absidia repens]
MLTSLPTLRYHGRQFINKHAHFLQLHYLYIALIIFIFSGLYYCQPGTSWAYIDSLYMATTGCTNTGINTIAVSSMSAFQISVLYFSSFFGSHIVISFVVVMVRKHYFYNRFQEVVRFNKARTFMESQRRQHSSGNSSRPNITLILQSGRKIDDDVIEHNVKQMDHTSRHSFTSSTTDSVCAYPLKMTRTCQHQHHLQHIPIERTAKNDTPTPIRHQQQHECERGKKTNSSQHVPPPTLSHQREPNESNPDHWTASKASLFGNTSTTGGTNIIFAENIQQQREAARQQLEKQRKLEVEQHELEYHERISSTQDHQQHQNDISGDEYYGGDNGAHEHVDIISLARDQTELTKEQRYLVGGAEYRALDLLTIVIPLYYLVIVFGTSFAFKVYITVSPYAQKVLLTSNGNNMPINSWYFSFFICLSAMNNLGLSQIDASMVPFQNSPFPLLVCGFLILAGNTAYPIFLRFMLWCLYHLTPHSFTMHRETLRYLLDYPRRCYTTLFPALQTRWLLAILIAINLTEIVVYISTNFWLPVMNGIPAASQLLDGLFQGIATRNAGFSVVNLPLLNPGTILVYIVAMYMGVYPVAISMRNSNVYQERSLGIYKTECDPPYTDNYDDHLTDDGILFKIRKQQTISSVMTTSKKIFSRLDFFVMTQIQRQLTKDICWVVVGIFCICVLEARAIMSPSSVTFVSVVYECVSAFACVGGSFGGSIPGTSQSADYRIASKLVLIILMYHGRHRGLPAAIDRAVLLPSEQLDWSDTEEQRRLYRCSSCITTTTGDGIGDNSNHLGSNFRVVYHRSETV